MRCPKTYSEEMEMEDEEKSEVFYSQTTIDVFTNGMVFRKIVHYRILFLTAKIKTTCSEKERGQLLLQVLRFLVLYNIRMYNDTRSRGRKKCFNSATSS